MEHMPKTKLFSPNVFGRSQKGRFKLPTGQTIRSNNPISEFDRNVKGRWAMLMEEEMFADLPLADLWGIDAYLRRKGRSSQERANALGFDLAGLRLFDDRVRELDHTVWKKAADFYRGLKASGIFEQTMLVYGGVYRNHDVWDWSHIRAECQVSRETFLRRVKANVPLADLFDRARPKRPATRVQVGGVTFVPRALAAALGLPRAHVRDGIERGLTAAEILDAPRRPRGRPAKNVGVSAT
jgi:hypothetical protein